ncbi:MAG: histidine phosphatase family protein [Clostridia bacterium]|nr:histidine phosphatase family protein [Clostridia bacterium]
MTRLILIRHGESVANSRDMFAGHLDIDLHPNGEKQAQITAEYIRDNFKVDKVYSSDLKRAYFTGKAVADLLGMEVIKHRGMREIGAGKWDGMIFRDIIREYKDDYTVWLNDIGNAKCTGGESVRALGERIMNTLTEIAEKEEGKTVVVATHATPIRVSCSIITKGSVDEMNNVSWPSNASVSVYEYDSGKWECKVYSYDSHLADLVTVLPGNV